MVPSNHKQDEKEKAHSRAHPLRQTKSIADDIADRISQRKDTEERIIEDINDWKKLLNRIAATPDGQEFFSKMLKACNLFTPSNGRDTVGCVIDRQRQDFYLRHVRPYLDKSVRSEFE